MSDPGASRVRKGAEFERSATASSLVVLPTLIAEVTHAGALIASVFDSFPLETMVAIPTERRLSMICFNPACFASHSAWL